MSTAAPLRVLAGDGLCWHAERMDLATWVMVAVITWTVLGLLLVALIWKRAPVKAILAWLGIALIPLGIWLVGLSQAAIDGWNTLATWWQGLVFTMPVMVGLGVLGLAAGLLVLSRFVPTRPRTPKQPDNPPTASRPTTSIPSGPSSAYHQPPRSQAEQTLLLPENRPNP